MALYNVTLKILDYDKKKKYRKSFTGVKKGVTVGRSKKADLTLQDDRISSLHCQIAFSGDSIFVIDQDSSNGTFLEGKKIKKAAIELEELFKLGHHKIMVEKLEVIGDAEEEFEEEEYQEDEGDEEEYEDEYEDEDQEDDQEEETAENHVAFALDNIKGFLGNPLQYLDKVKYQALDQTFTLTIIAICGFISSLEFLLKTPLLGVASMGFYVLYIFGYGFVCEATKNFTGLKGNRLKVLHFFAVYGVAGLPLILISLLPVIGTLSYLILLILGIKGFFRAFKPKVIPMLIVWFGYSVILGSLYAPIGGMLTPKPSAEELKKMQMDSQQNVLKMMETIIKKSQKQ